MRIDRRRLAWTLLLSLVLHGALLFLLRAQAPLVVPPPRAEPGAPVAVDIVVEQLPPPVSAPAVLPPRPERPPSAAPSPGVAQAPRASTSESVPAMPKASRAVGGGQASGPREGSLVAREAPAGEAAAPLPTLPQGLVPVLPGVAEGGGETVAARPGRTLRAGEGPAEDPAVALAREAGGVRVRVQGIMQDGLAEARVRNGQVDSYFLELAKALRKETASPPPFEPRAGWAETFLAATGPGSAQYGRAGNPYAPGQTPEAAWDRLEASPSARLARERPGSSLDHLHQQQLAGFFLREFAEGRFGQGIVALVELRQARDGRVLASALVQSSGSKPFDDYVLRSAPLAVAKLPAPPAEGMGLHADGLRSLWSFEGRIVFMHRTKPGEMGGGDVAKAAGMTALSALTGGLVPSGTTVFDETTGETKQMDLTRPAYECRVQLLRVY